jgi:hypothetical protein
VLLRRRPPLAPPTRSHHLLHDHSAQLTAVDCVELLISRLARDKDRFPNLKEVVFTGHSAGGQLAWRMAMLNDCDPVGTDGVRAKELGTSHIRYVFFCQLVFVVNLISLLLIVVVAHTHTLKQRTQ